MRPSEALNRNRLIVDKIGFGLRRKALWKMKLPEGGRLKLDKRKKDRAFTKYRSVKKIMFEEQVYSFLNIQ